MAGANISIKVDDKAVLAALARLESAVDDLSPAFKAIGEYLDLATRQRFDREESPDGVPWQPLKDKTIKRKKRGNQILVDSADLRDTLRYNADSDGLEFGTDRIYGATHQFGRPEDGIPARPWLGIGDDDRRVIIDIIDNYLRAAID